MALSDWWISNSILNKSPEKSIGKMVTLKPVGCHGFVIWVAPWSPFRDRRIKKKKQKLTQSRRAELSQSRWESTVSNAGEQVILPKN